MFEHLYSHSLRFFAKHPILNSLSHSAGGFGLALVLQEYLKGDAFISVWIGWILIIFSALIHFRSLGK